ncbi:cysteine desulfurase DndA [Eilatimonas milleporae]|uniref:Cysteine desulfurase n=1 Tax=Eilatimonas milleporae TaxID=911205 RepID=A0A3M0BY37_9PROT|nr:cysteine desulfurase DndA [Eilatimonas milleporae]RMB01952.1 cysteine desulfurase [Eilatimonas milleporae]
MKHTFASAYKQEGGPVYLDCNATAPIEPVVRDAVLRWMTDEMGNAGSRTHEYGLRAKRAVQHARDQVARVVDGVGDEVVFTSGATESNNLALLGLAEHGVQTDRRHIVSTAIEHKAVLEPLEVLEARGFSVTLVRPDENGLVKADSIKDALRPDTLLVSVMHANNETGAVQPLVEIATALEDHDAFFHVDAAQGYGKVLESLRSKRIDLISVSSHKIYGPLGIGALIARRRGFKRPPLKALMYGGGQERGLRPGTLPVPLIVGFGVAAEAALKNQASRQVRCRDIRHQALAALEPLGIRMHADPDRTLSHVMNFSVPGVDSEAVMVALKDVAAVSNGSACTSQSYSPSHVLEAMGLPEEEIAGAIRVSWSHLTPDVEWPLLVARLDALR